jgi:hypothetical protein
VEDWEVPRFLGKFRSQEAVSRVNGAPLVEYTGNGQALLYNLRETRDPSLAVTKIVERWEGPRCQHTAPMESPFR